MRASLPLLLLLLAAAACGSVSNWDPAASVPEPLALPAGMDSLSPHAFYSYGQQILEHTPAKAAVAFYWASRLDPAWADPIYARRIAHLMSRPATFRSYMRGVPATVNSPGIQRLDSLYLKALVLNPFLRREQDAVALRYVIVNEITTDPAYRGVSRWDVEMAVDRWLLETTPTTRGWLAQSEGRMADAAQNYERAIEKGAKAEVVADLARVYVHMGRFDDARQNMVQAIDLLRKRDEDSDELVRLYNSKALFEYSLGLILEQIGEMDEARAAYARALQEDLSYHPAHMRLGELALAAGDTMTALSEMALAAEISDADADVRLRYARVLAGAGRFDDAEAQLRQAIELEPLFAIPHLELARVLERAGRSADALDSYRTFVTRAARTDSGIGEANRQIEMLAQSDGGESRP